MRPISFLSTEDLVKYGCKEIELLCQYYGQPKSHSWKERAQRKEAHAPALIDPVKCQKEWQELKGVVLAEKYPRDRSNALWQLIQKFHGSDFPEMIKLGQLYFTLAVHTAGCERGFSVQNSTLAPSRNRLQEATQDTLIRVRLGPDRNHFNFASALTKWKDKRDRRIYELNYNTSRGS